MNLQSKTYESSRAELRYGTISTAQLIFKSTAGICYFNYHFAIAKVGISQAFFYNIFVCYLTSYGIYKVTLIANEIDCKPGNGSEKNTENDNFENRHGAIELNDANSRENDSQPDQNEATNENIVRVYHELPVQLKIKYAYVMQVLILISCASMSFASNISNLSQISGMIAQMAGLNLQLAKLFVCIFFCLLQLFFVEPEKIKPITFFVSGVQIFIVIVVVYNSIDIYSSNQNIEYDYYLYTNSGVFLGISSYAFESIAHIFNVRRMMVDRSKMPKIQVLTFIFIGLSYYLVGGAVYLAYGKDNVRKVIFDYYIDKNNWMSLLKNQYMITAVFGILFNSITVIENLEPIAVTRKQLTNSDNGSLNSNKVLFYRMLLVILSVGVTLISDNFNRILSFTGSTASPLLSFVQPILICWNYDEKCNRKQSKFIYYHDCFILIGGVFVGICGIYSTIFGFSD